jgi:hypothetical protein
MLETVAIILVVLWLLEFVTSYDVAIQTLINTTRKEINNGCVPNSLIPHAK